MSNTIHRSRLKAQAARIGVCAVMMLIAGQTPAQTVYRIVGPDGKITFSDTPPAAPATVVGTSGKSTDAGSAAGTALPFELRQVVSKYPVTLYTSSNCAPCNSGRTLLSSRGVPFTEKTVTTPDDAQALQRISGESSLPFLTIGGQQIKGYADSEWTQFLNAAGYPQTSVLPAGYRNPAAAPLVAVQKPAPAATPETAPTDAHALPSAPPATNPSNPAGIRF